jgi:hypothetical protein
VPRLGIDAVVTDLGSLIHGGACRGADGAKVDELDRLFELMAHGTPFVKMID